MPEKQTPSEIVTEAEAAVASIADPELKKIAFEKTLQLSSVSQPALIDSISRLIQVLSVVTGVIISVLSFNASRQSEANARKAEAEAAKLEVERFKAERQDTESERRLSAAKPFLELRQKLYLEAVQVAAVLVTPETHSEEELNVAKTRFRELYVAELSLIEGAGVEAGMIGLAKEVDPELTKLTPKQSAAYNLSHALRDSLVKSWNLEDDVVDNPH